MDSEAGSACDPSCLVLESDFLLSGELEFGDSEIVGLDRDGGTSTSNSLSEQIGCLSDIESATSTQEKVRQTKHSRPFWMSH